MSRDNFKAYLDTLPAPARIMVVEDDPEDHRLLKAKFLAANVACELFFVFTGHEAIERLRAEDFDLVLLDLKMPAQLGDGNYVLDHISATGKDVKIAILSGSDENVATEAARHAPVLTWLDKNKFDVEAIRKLFEHLSL